MILQIGRVCRGGWFHRLRGVVLCIGKSLLKGSMSTERPNILKVLLSSRPNMVSLYSSNPLVDGLSDSLRIVKVVFQLRNSCAMDSGKSIPMCSTHPSVSLS